MEVQFENKPSDELIDRYCKKIEFFLSSLNLKLKIELKDMGSPVESYVDGALTSKEKWWLGNFMVSTTWGEFKLKSKPRFGIDGSINDHDIWRDASIIQDEVYKNFKLPFKHPDTKDIYWSLWDKMPV